MPADSLRKIREYNCAVDKPATSGYPSGGNVLELSDKSLFVSMAFPDSRIFIVDTNDRLVWSAVAEKYNSGSGQWESVNLFRASIIADRKHLEEIIWNAEMKKQEQK